MFEPFTRRLFEIEGDMCSVALISDFEAVVGRHTLLYAADQTTALKAPTHHLRPITQHSHISTHPLYPVSHVPDDTQDGPITYRWLWQVHQLCRLVDGNGVMTPSAQKVIA